MHARLSLARTAKLLTDTPFNGSAEAATAAPTAATTISLTDAADADLSPRLEQTEWGPARRYHAPAAVEGAPMAWDRPASSLGSSPPRW